MNQPTLEHDQAVALLQMMEASLEHAKVPASVQVWFRDAVAHLLAAHARPASKEATEDSASKPAA